MKKTYRTFDEMDTNCDGVIDRAEYVGPSTPFIASEQFAGSKPGYAFQMGPEGLGYYHVPVPVSMPGDFLGQGGAMIQM